jgi:hypothetical protein
MNDQAKVDKMLLVHRLSDQGDLEGATKAYNQYLKEYVGDPRMLGTAGYAELKKRNYGLAYVLLRTPLWSRRPARRLRCTCRAC